MLNFIGNGSAFNFERGNNSAFIRRDDELILIDCGGTTLSKMVELEVLEPSVKHVRLLVTHTHGDHVGGLGDLALYLYYSHGEPCKNKLTIYTSLGGDIVSLMSLFGCVQDVHYEIVRVFDKVLVTPGLKCLMIPTDHVDELLSYSFVINCDGVLMYYSGDANTLAESVVERLRDNQLDYFYVDTCGAEYPGNVHISLKHLSELIEPELRHKVWCMHLDTEFDESEARRLGFNVTQIYNRYSL